MIIVLFQIKTRDDIGRAEYDAASDTSGEGAGSAAEGCQSWSRMPL